MSSSIDVRPLQDADLEGVVRLYNRGGFGPVTGGQPLTIEDCQTWLAGNGTYLFLVAVDKETEAIVGTLGLFLVSEQRVARPGEVYASAFFIDEDYRNGSIPNWLFITALRALIRDGYSSLSATVSPANLTALSLYKRIGLYRLRSSVQDYDGQIELRGYQPLVMRTIKSMKLEEAENIQHQESLWRFLMPTQSLRTSNIDSELWHGLEVVTYEMRAGNLDLRFRVDVGSDGLVEMETNEVLFRIYPEQDVPVLVGEEARLICELTNKAAQARMYGVSFGDPHAGDAHIPYQSFAPGESRRQEFPFYVTRTGMHIVRGRLEMEQCSPDFQVGILAQAAISMERAAPLQVLQPGEPAQLLTRLSNHSRQVLTGSLRANAPTLTRLDVSPAEVALPAGATIEVKLSSERIETGLHSLSLAMREQGGQTWQTEAVVQPVLLAEQRVVYQEAGQYVLESAELRVCLDRETGFLRLWDKASARLVLYEAWPDVGPPHPGGLKRGRRRALRALPTDEGVLTLEERLEDGSFVQRTLRLLEQTLLEINQCWTPGQSGAQKPQKTWKTYGRCAFRQDTLTVPLLQGRQRRAVIYGEYPYETHEYESIPCADLPRQCSGYAENWSAFEENGLTVGALWQDASEVCFGGHWMPALCFELQTGAWPTPLPSYAYSVGRGGAEEVSRRWRKLYGGQGATDNESEGTPEHKASPDLVMSALQALDALRQADVQKQEVRVTFQPQRQRYRVENGQLGFEVAPEQAGGITSLTYKGANLLQVAPPRPKPFGDNAIWYGGIHPAKVNGLSSLMESYLCDQGNILQFQARPITEQDEQGQTWGGVALTCDDLSVSYETLPDAPILRLVAEYRNTRPVTQTFELLFHCFFRAMQSRQPRTVYYTRRGERASLREERKSRRVYANDWNIVSLGKDLAVALYAEAGTPLELATYEWARDGFQHMLIQRFHVAPGEVQRAYARLLVMNSVEQLLATTETGQVGAQAPISA